MSILAIRLATLVDARLRCIKNDNPAWADRHEERAEAIVKEDAPSGGGFDNGTTLDIDASTGEKLVFKTSFHHMDEHGGYTGWTDHTITVRGSLQHGFTFKVSGRNRNNIKDYIDQVFQRFLNLPERET